MSIPSDLSSEHVRFKSEGALQEKVQKLNGRPISRSKVVPHRGRDYLMVDAELPRSNASIAAHGAAGAAISLCTLGIAPAVSSSFRKWGFNTKEEKPVYMPYEESAETRELKAQESIKTLGYNPNSPKSVQKYLNEHPNLVKGLVDANGHKYYVEERQSGISSFIFVPHGDITKAYSVQVWKASDGSQFTGSDLKKKVREFCASYGTIKEKWDEMAESFVPSMAKDLFVHKEMQRRLPGITINLNHPQHKAIRQDILKKLETQEGKTAFNAFATDSLKEELLQAAREQKCTVVMAKDHVRMYRADIDPQAVNTNSIYTGVKITLSEDTQKEIERIQDKRRMEDTEKLGSTSPPAVKN